MRIAFRTDASIQIGTGHVMRCLTLADAFRECDAQCTFLGRQHPGHLAELIRQRGHEAIVFDRECGEFDAPADPPHAPWLGTDWATDVRQTREALGEQVMDWLVVDHYALDRRWEHLMRSQTIRIMVIDDLADRPHDCDLLLDQNLGRAEKDYGVLLDPTTKTLIGPQYALLRPEFAYWRAYSLARREQPQLKNLLIAMGGVDQGNVTGRVLDVLQTSALPADIQLTVVMGTHAPWLRQVQAQAPGMPWPTQVLAGVSNMAELMANSDLAIGAAGGTAWERCALGLPTLVIVLAENQNKVAKALQARGTALVVQNILQIGELIKSVIDAEGESVALRKMSHAAATVTDGKGALRVARKVLTNHV